MDRESKKVAKACWWWSGIVINRETREKGVCRERSVKSVGGPEESEAPSMPVDWEY